MSNLAGVAQTSLTLGVQLQVLINSYLSMPVLKASSTAINVVPTVWTAGGVRIEPISYRTEYSAEISEQLLVNVNGGKDFLTDNIAARPRTWKITGYVPSDLIPDVLRQAANVGGSVVPQLAGITVPMSLSTEISGFLPSLKTRQKYLESLFFGRTTFEFKTRDNEYIHNAVMSSLMIERKPEAQNKLYIDVSIKEINILSSTILSSSSTPSSGTRGNTDPNNLGSASSTKVSVPSQAGSFKVTHALVSN
jgi:hypothetical protein